MENQGYLVIYKNGNIEVFLFSNKYEAKKYTDSLKSIKTIFSIKHNQQYRASWDEWRYVKTKGNPYISSIKLT